MKSLEADLVQAGLDDHQLNLLRQQHTHLRGEGRSAELGSLRAHKDQAQLAECLASISQTRDDKANSAARKFAVIAFVASLAYSGIAVLFSLAVVYLQNEVVLSGA
ncbi:MULTISPECIES: hypothetical protein [unclassified Limnobacter]|uniref:hypothetical protein n=1 Tax=unclassified Limnobacter TaxID=2630203 RepID=UPI000C469553|nr:MULTISPECIES: hypothetical protein [unclassified Limnobacter]MAZ09741.1 hypothetical protein [Sutterellaceae bacterium]|tara:strand:+ start:11209 stop:11526 length:318 start_codon:yes stop_codon:yes gene_type:complete